MSTSSIIVWVAVMTFSILLFFGLAYLTPVAFGNRSYSSLSSTQKNLVKMYVVVTWVGIAISVILSLSDAFGGY